MTLSAAASGQVTKSAAQIYDEFFVPALFGEWAGRLCDAAGIAGDCRVLDVACGTGATTREAAMRVGDTGRIIGLDCNDDMLAVARSRAPDIEWTEGTAEALPFESDTFDVILCQFGLMFFEDEAKALGEMVRVLRPGGRIALSVWDDVANSAGYAAMIELIDEMFGREAADALRAPFVLGDKHRFMALLETAGLGDAAVTTVSGSARFPSIREWVRMDVRGWTLADMIDDSGFEDLVIAAQDRLSHFAAKDGAVRFPAPAHVAVWTENGSWRNSAV